MIDFDEELKHFKSALDVDDIEQYLQDVDISDMHDVFVRIMLDKSK